MKKTLLTLATLLSTTVFAETFEKIEFQLPETAQEWTTSRSESTGPNGTAKVLMYMKTTPLEMFVVVSSSEIGSVPETFDMEKAKTQIQALVPSLNPELEILETDDSSALFKMNVKDEKGTLSMVSFIRTVYGEKGTATLLYQTASNDVDPMWLDVLKSATVL